METTTSPRTHLERGFRLETAGNTERALEAYRDALVASADPLERAEAHLRTARVLSIRARWDEAVAESRQAVQAARARGADDLAAEAMNVEFGVLWRRGAFGQAYALAEEALALARSPRVRGITLQNLGTAAWFQRDFALAARFHEQSVTAFRAAQYEFGIAVALTNQSAAARELGEPERALELGREAAQLCRRLNALNVLLNAVQNQAHALAMLGQFDEAEELLTESLGHFSGAQNPIGQAECLEVMGELSHRRGVDPSVAKRCYERAREIARRADAAWLVDRLTQRLEGRTPPHGSEHANL